MVRAPGGEELRIAKKPAGPPVDERRKRGNDVGASGARKAMAGDGNRSGGSSVRQFGVLQRSWGRGGGSGESDGNDRCTTNVTEAISRGGCRPRRRVWRRKLLVQSFLAPSTSPGGGCLKFARN